MEIRLKEVHKVFSDLFEKDEASLLWPGGKGQWVAICSMHNDFIIASKMKTAPVCLLRGGAN